jgi:methyl-accepting chemotaxis protein
MATLMGLIREYSTSLIQLVNASPLTDAGAGIPDALKSVIDNANTISGLLAQAKGEMDRFSREVGSTAKNISDILDNGEQIRSIEPLTSADFQHGF